MAVSLERPVEEAHKQNGANEGSRTWQTLLTAAAFPAGDDVGDDEEALPLSTQRKAAALGVRKESFNVVVARVKRLKADLNPTAVIKAGAYWFCS